MKPEKTLIAREGRMTIVEEANEIPPIRRKRPKRLKRGEKHEQRRRTENY